MSHDELLPLLRTILDEAKRLDHLRHPHAHNSFQEPVNLAAALRQGGIPAQSWQRALSSDKTSRPNHSARMNAFIELRYITVADFFLILSHPFQGYTIHQGWTGIDNLPAVKNFTASENSDGPSIFKWEPAVETSRPLGKDALVVWRFGDFIAQHLQAQQSKASIVASVSSNLDVAPPSLKM